MIAVKPVGSGVFHDGMPQQQVDKWVGGIATCFYSKVTWPLGVSEVSSASLYLLTNQSTYLRWGSKGSRGVILQH